MKLWVAWCKTTASREQSTRTFRNTLQRAWNLPGLREHACHSFPGKLKGVLHSQEDGTNIFPSQLHNMSELCVFHYEHPWFQQICKDCPKFEKKCLSLRADNTHFTKSFFKKVSQHMYFIIIYLSFLNCDWLLIREVQWFYWTQELLVPAEKFTVRMPMVRLELTTPGLQTQCSSHWVIQLYTAKLNSFAAIA